MEFPPLPRPHLTLPTEKRGGGEPREEVGEDVAEGERRVIDLDRAAWRISSDQASRRLISARYPLAFSGFGAGPSCVKNQAE